MKLIYIIIESKKKYRIFYFKTNNNKKYEKYA